MTAGLVFTARKIVPFNASGEYTITHLWMKQLQRKNANGLHDNTSEERKVLKEIRKQIEIGGCKIGGYPRYIQDDPRLYSKEWGKTLEEWDTLLFQLDDDTFTSPAGDIGEMDINLNGGTLNFLIRSEDLKNRDFSQVLAQWACS